MPTYEEQGLDMMRAHLKQGAALTPSQVVRTTARGGERGKAKAMRAEFLPAIAMQPRPADAISVAAGVVTIPD